MIKMYNNYNLHLNLVSDITFNKNYNEILNICCSQTNEYNRV